MAELRGIILLLCTIAFHVSHGQMRWTLMNQITCESDVIPLSNNTPLNVSLNFKLMNIVEADTEKDQVEVVLWTQASWKPPYYSSLLSSSSLDQVSLPASRVWTPDLSFYNAIAAPELLSPDRLVVSKDWSVVYVPSQRVRFTCDLKNVDAEPGATCRIKVGSWTHDNKQLALITGEGVDITEYFDSPKYDLLSATQTLNHRGYSCCEKIYDDIEITFTFRKK
ncbi:hypothetical protein Btru_023632 [Bulinus truncatus]|nr:hypothetical protein Btru_023632 [Bulinus truncatus]